MKNRVICNRRCGFTLLEVMSALLLMGVIMTMVLAIARSSLSLSKAIVDSQGEEMKQQAFFDLLNRRFAELPGNAILDLAVEDTGSQYLSTLTMQNAPMNFSWGGQDRVTKSVTLVTVPKRSGFTDIVLRFYENETLEGTATGVGSQFKEEEPFAEVVLLENVAYFEWRVLNSSTMEWQYEWNERGRRPLQMELVMSIGVSGKELKQIFWLPPKQNPELMMRQLAAPAAGPTHFETRDTGVNVEVTPPSPTPNPGGGQ